MPKLQFCLFASTPDVLEHGSIVRVLTGTPEQLARRAVEWGYDGIEFMPDPEHVPQPESFEVALRETGAVMPVVNTGRMASQGMALLHEDPVVQRRSVQAFKDILDFAGYFGVRVNLGAARGRRIPGVDEAEMIRLTESVFGDLVEHARGVATTIMLEPADPSVTDYITTVEEAASWAQRVDDPAFNVMLDTYQLSEAEPSFEHGVRSAQGRANHIHLFDPGRWPPGILPDAEALDWPRIARVLDSEGFRGTGSVCLVPEGGPESPARKALAYLQKTLDRGCAR